LIEMTLIMFAASSASGSWQYSFANTKQASASWTWNVIIDVLHWLSGSMYILLYNIIQIKWTATTLFAYIEYRNYFSFNFCTLNTKAHFPKNSIIILFNIMMSSATIITHACTRLLILYTHTSTHTQNT